MYSRMLLLMSVSVLLYVTTSSPQRGPVQPRYLPPSSQTRPCTSSRCTYGDKAPDSYGDDGYKSPDEGIDHKPKPDIASSHSDYDTGPGYGGGSSSSGYKPKPESSGGRHDGDAFKAVYGGGGGYNTKPKDDYPASRPVEIKPDETVDYKPKPAVVDDYPSKPAVAGGAYGVRPVASKPVLPVHDEYYPKPAVDVDDDYKSKPVDRDEYNPKPVADGGYGASPVDSSVYNPKPVNTGVYGAKPVDSAGYNPNPKDDYGGKLPADDSDYDSKPGGGGYGYNPEPKDDYIPKPVSSSSYPKPPISGGYGGGYNPKPYDDDKAPKPDSGVYGEDYSDEYKPGYEDKESGYVEKPASVLEDGNCICVPYYQCKDGHIVTDGSGIIDARRRPPPDEDLPLDGKFKPPSCGPFHVCCNTPESSTVKPYEHRCGVRNPSGINSRILSPSNQGEADFGEWPWQAAVLKTEGTVNIFQCGGVLIDKYHVLTVAHCVFHLYKYNEYPLKVRLGEWDTQTTSEFLAHEDYKVSKIIVHPEYRNTSLWNDIAILRLQEPVLFAPHIDTVCLPKYDEMFAGQNCVVTGWGKDSYKGGSFSNIMKEVALQVLDSYGCEEMLRKTRLGRFFQLHEGFVCAGGEHGLDSCKGDGGGPLVCYRKDRSYALAGLVSWGIDCGQPGVPGVYVKVQKYLDWISKNTGVHLQEYWPKA